MRRLGLQPFISDWVALANGDPVESAEVAEGRETMRNYNVWGDEEEDF